VNLPSPALVPQAAVRRLPRWALLLFCLAYVVPGFVGRDPWKSADVAAFGVMQALARGESPWWTPSLLGLPAQDPGPLPYWLGAWAIQALPWLDAATASRLPFALLLALTLGCVWYATYHLARLPAAQPVAFAFGGEAQPRDYARTLADAAVLALMACLGLAQLGHEATPDLARLAFLSMLLLALARATDPGRGLGPTLAWGLSGLLGSGLSDHAGPALVLLATGMLLIRPVEASNASPGAARVRVAISLGLALPGLAWWAPHLGPAWPTNPAAWIGWGKLLLWFTWPAWPLLLWTLWRWRHRLRSPHLALPLGALLIGLIDSLLGPSKDRALLLALPACATLAAFALPTLRRSVAALIDWFTLLFFSACALVIWVVWLAMHTGVPAKPAANVARLAPGFVAEFSLTLFLPALAATLAWLALVAWRVGRHRQALWKSLVLPAAGSTLCWLLLMTLWLPLLDVGRSYGPFARRVAALVPAEACVAVHALNQAQVAALRHHGGLELVRLPADDARASDCPVLIAPPGAAVDPAQWTPAARVPRLTDNKETLLMYRRRPD